MLYRSWLYFHWISIFKLEHWDMLNKRGFLHRCAFCSLGAAATLQSGLVLGRDGVEVGRESLFTKLVSADDIERSAAQQYQQMLQQAQEKRALAPADHPEVQRLRSIAQKIIPHSFEWNARARQWRWEINLLGSSQINAFCMPGGKIAFYTGILQTLKLTDDEVAMVMGHEVAHALREHARERMGKGAATNIGAGLVSQIFGLGQLGNTALNYGAQLLTLKFSREDESEADLVGMELAARAGYDPHAGVTLWQKMGAAAKGAPPQWLSTHPSSDTRIHEIERNLPKVQHFFDRARPKAVLNQ
jgi:predicted Zn-dependent protease